MNQNSLQYLDPILNMILIISRKFCTTFTILPRLWMGLKEYLIPNLLVNV